MKQVKVLLVVPCHNEQNRINEDYFKEISGIAGIKLVFVNDGSTDNTAKIIQNFGWIGKSEVYNLESNVGKANAIHQGMLSSLEKNHKAQWIGFLDADGAFDQATIRKILAVALAKNCDDAEAIYSSRVRLLGHRIMRNDFRHYASRLVITFLGINWKSIPYDSQSGFKIYRNTKEFREAISGARFKTRWFFDIEFHIHLSLKYGRDIIGWEEPVMGWHDVKDSKINFLEKARILWEILLIFSLITRNRELLSLSARKPHCF